MPDGSPNRESSLFKHQAQPNCAQSGDSLSHLPSVVDRDNTLRREDIDDAGQSAVEMQVSVLIHLQDPVELLPHVVNIDAD